MTHGKHVTTLLSLCLTSSLQPDGFLDKISLTLLYLPIATRPTTLLPSFLAPIMSLLILVLQPSSVVLSRGQRETRLTSEVLNSVQHPNNSYFYGSGATIGHLVKTPTICSNKGKRGDAFDSDRSTRGGSVAWMKAGIERKLARR